MEQLVARRAHNPKVAGSSPAPATNFSQVADYAYKRSVLPIIGELGNV
jgi:hypothetical protein